MRIRKRQVPLPLSSLLPVPLSSLSLSDPYSSGSSLLPPVQLLLHSAAAADGAHRNPEPPPDQATTSRPPIGVDRAEMMINGEGKLIGDDSSVLTPSKIGGSTQVHRLSSVSHRGGRWREGEKTSSFPSKKRGNRDDDYEEKEGRGEGEEVKNVDVAGTPDSKSIRLPSGGVKKRGRGAGGGTVMEGSRCSRVNGRGWRCCQPTLVGYSLCEHHLGKGRLRSVTNVRSRRQAKPTAASRSGSPQVAAPKPPKAGEEDEDYVDEKKTSKKGPKLGVVKARSMSSLLGQDSNSSNGATPSTAATAEAVRSENVKDSSTDEA